MIKVVQWISRTKITLHLISTINIVQWKIFWVCNCTVALRQHTVKWNFSVEHKESLKLSKLFISKYTNAIRYSPPEYFFVSYPLGKGGTSTIIQDVIGNNMSFDDLKDIFTSAGVNLFPEDDAFCYVEGWFWIPFLILCHCANILHDYCLSCIGTCEKHYVMESHLYDCMAAVALTHNFTWSRWNFMSGRRSCILLMREIVENRKTVRFFIL